MKKGKKYKKLKVLLNEVISENERIAIVMINSEGEGVVVWSGRRLNLPNKLEVKKLLKIHDSYY